MDAHTAARRRSRITVALVALGVALIVVVVGLNRATVTGWFAAAPHGPGNTLLTSTAEQVGQARRELAELAVIARPAPSRDYRRAAFGDAWSDTDHNGCNQRDDVLLRDVLTSEPYRVGRQHNCDHDVLAGSWLDAYTGNTVSVANAKAQAESVQIDHIVALSVAWRYGAHGWSDATRLAFANDLRNLVAVGGETNRRKGGSDASEWLPVRGAQCGFAVRYITVKAAYTLPTDASEQRALAAMLDTCG